MDVTAPTGLRRSPLDDRHRALGATLTAFAGWEMPLDYGSVVAEHRAVRERCGVFDLSHLGTVRVTGADALATVQRAFTNDAAALTPGRAHYTLCLDERGGITDDLLLYRLPWGFFVVPNAANAAGILATLEAAAPRAGDVAIADVKDDLACLAVQGPDAADVVGAAGVDVTGMRYLDCRPLGPEARGGFSGVLARSGYTGEHGYELFTPAAQAPALWDRLVAAGAQPAGLGARDTLRLEMGYPLHGSDISPATSPVEAGLVWAVRPQTEFVGRDAFAAALERGATRRLRGLRALGRGVPRPHCEVRSGGARVGETTSGTFSPTLRVGVALAYLDTAVELGAEVEIDVRGRALPARVERPPFVGSDPRV
jgi:aminomethyltransferase